MQKNASIFSWYFYNNLFSRRSRVWRHCIRRLRRPTQTPYSPTPHSQNISKKIHVNPFLQSLHVLHCIRCFNALTMTETQELIFPSVSWLFAGYFFLFLTLVRRIFLLQQVYQASTKLYNNTSVFSVKHSDKSKKH